MPPKPLITAFLAALALLLGYLAQKATQLSLDAGGLRSLMPILVSAVLLIAALWVILAQKYTPTDRHWAYGAVGTVVGYWLHS